VTLYCATGNPGKLREWRLALTGYELEVVSLPACEETGLTFEENARQKAVYYSGHAPGLLFAEDSGLEVDALGGAPGVFSARFAGEGTSDEDNNRLLIEKLRGVSDRSARYVCVIAIAKAGVVVRTFRGEVAGKIIDIPRGSVRDKTDGGLELTQWTTVSDMHNLRWYFKTYDDETIRVVDLKKAVAAANGQIRTIKMESEQPIVDASTTFMSGKQASDAEQ